MTGKLNQLPFTKVNASPPNLKHVPAPDPGLGPQLRDPRDCLSAFTVLRGRLWIAPGPDGPWREVGGNHAD